MSLVNVEKSNLVSLTHESESEHPNFPDLKPDDQTTVIDEDAAHSMAEIQKTMENRAANKVDTPNTAEDEEHVIKEPTVENRAANKVDTPNTAEDKEHVIEEPTVENRAANMLRLFGFYSSLVLANVALTTVPPP